MAKLVYAIIAIIALILLLAGMYYGSKLTTPPINETSETPEAKITKQLVGMNLTYSNIAGQPMTFTITAEDITSIEQATLDNNTVWKVHVGDALAWNIYLDETGSRIIKEEQLFQT